MNGALTTPLSTMLPEALRHHHDWWLVALAFLVGLTTGAIVLRRRARRRARERRALPVVPSLRAQSATFTAEVDRARRYERALAVLVLKVEDAATVGAALGLVEGTNGRGLVSERARALVQSARQVMFWNVGYVLKDLLRETDVAACDVPEQQYVVLLPEADEEEAFRAATRLGERLFDVTGVQVRRGVAVYRKHGITIDDLVQNAAAMSDRVASGPLAIPSRERAVSKLQVVSEQRKAP